MHDDSFPIRNLNPCTGTTRAFREALSRYATGVTVVTVDSEIGPLGITANSFASVSLDPPLVLWAPAKLSQRFPAFTEARYFAIHVIAAEQKRISDGFSRDGTAWDGIDWKTNVHNVPLINDCLARFECEAVARYPGGDHCIVVAEVLQASWRDGTPLVFSQGRYGMLETPAPNPALAG